MKKAVIHKQWKLWAFSLFLMLTMMLGSSISVSAATSISTQTVKTTVANSGTCALRITWNKAPNASGYIVYRRESQRKPFVRIKKISMQFVLITKRMANMFIVSTLQF